MPNEAVDQATGGSVWQAKQVYAMAVISLVVGLAIGYLLDRFFHTKPWLTIIFLILGIVAAFRSLLSLAKEIDKEGRKK